jgi:ubiquinone/menaquinone biosynthesis C-methylase UbiE
MTQRPNDAHEYTSKTRSWLDDRYRATDSDGVYESHAPIYGFTPRLQLDIHKYLYRVLASVIALSRRHRIDTVLDVGCSEGYLAFLVQGALRCKVFGCDLSVEAVRNARRIFGISTFQADAQNLGMLPDNSMDLVLCTETLEHLPDPGHAIGELLRVSRKAVIVTVPAASEAEKARFRPPDEPHAHLHVFTRADVERAFAGHTVMVVGVLNRLLRWDILLNATEAQLEGKPRVSVAVYRALRAALRPVRRFYQPPLARRLIRLDATLAPMMPANLMYLVVAVKNEVPPSPAKADYQEAMERLFNTHVAPYRPDRS